MDTLVGSWLLDPDHPPQTLNEALTRVGLGNEGGGGGRRGGASSSSRVRERVGISVLALKGYRIEGIQGCDVYWLYVVDTCAPSMLEPLINICAYVCVVQRCMFLCR